MVWVVGSMDKTTKPPAPSRRTSLQQSPVRAKDVHQFVTSLISNDFHAKRVFSMANGAVGALHAATLSVHAIGLALAEAQGLNPKHAIKQVDRMLSNRGIRMVDFFHHWMAFVLVQRPEALLSLDWTEFDADDQSVICLSLITSHGRATPLLWKTVVKSELKDQRNDHEDELLAMFAMERPETLKRGAGLQARR